MVEDIIVYSNVGKGRVLCSGIVKWGSGVGWCGRVILDKRRLLGFVSSMCSVIWIELVCVSWDVQWNLDWVGLCHLGCAVESGLGWAVSVGMCSVMWIVLGCVSRDVQCNVDWVGLCQLGYAVLCGLGWLCQLGCEM